MELAMVAASLVNCSAARRYSPFSRSRPDHSTPSLQPVASSSNARAGRSSLFIPASIGSARLRCTLSKRDSLGTSFVHYCLSFRQVAKSRKHGHLSHELGSHSLGLAQSEGTGGPGRTRHAGGAPVELRQQSPHL